MRPLVVWALLLGLAVSADAQSLAEAARREQEKKRKQAKAQPARVYTEADLGSRPENAKGTFSQPPATKGAAASPAPEPSASPERDRALLEREWRARFAEARARIAEEDARAFEERIEVVFVAGIPVQQKVRVRVETPALVAAKQALLDLEEELRRTGGLPGWGRE